MLSVKTRHVKTRHGLSQFVVSNVGLRQGGNLSPFLFVFVFCLFVFLCF